MDDDDRWLRRSMGRLRRKLCCCLPGQRREPAHNEKERAEEIANDEGFGVKSISYFGGVALLVNNITGPAMVTIAPMFQNAGWLLPLLMMLIATVWSSFASTLMCAVMAMIPGNNRLQSRIEMTSLVDRLFYDFGRAPFWICSIFFNASLFFLNVSSIIVSAQTMDFVLIALFDWTGALELYPNFGFTSRTRDSFDQYSVGIANSDSPYDDPLTPEIDTYVISLGFLLTMLITVPLGFVNLDDNIYVQIFSFYTMFAIVGFWVIIFCMEGLDFSNSPTFEACLPAQANVLGNILFNYAFVVTVPSWVNEKNPKAPINSSIWISTIISTVFYLVMGFFGAWGAYYTGNQDILDVLINLQLESSALQTMLRVSVYLFPTITLLSSIPIYSIVIRYNLLENKQCSVHWANFWGVIFPWLFSIPFCTGGGLANVINWTGLFIQGTINFLIPFVLYMRAIRMQDRGVLTDFLLEYDNRFPELALDAPPTEGLMIQEEDALISDFAEEPREKKKRSSRRMSSFDASELAGLSDRQLELEIPPHDPYPAFFSHLGVFFEPFNFATFLFIGFAIINVSVIIVSFVNVGMNVDCSSVG